MLRLEGFRKLSGQGPGGGGGVVQDEGSALSRKVSSYSFTDAWGRLDWIDLPRGKSRLCNIYLEMLLLLLRAFLEEAGNLWWKP